MIYLSGHESHNLSYPREFPGNLILTSNSDWEIKRNCVCKQFWAYDAQNCHSSKYFRYATVSSRFRYLSSIVIPWSLQPSNSSSKTVMRFLATLINAFSRDSLRCALWFLLSYVLAHYRLTICLFLFLSFSLSFIFFLSHVASVISYLCPALFLFIRPCIYLSVCSAHVLSVCVYVRRAALNNMHYGREWMEL